MTPAGAALIQALVHHGGSPDFHDWIPDLRERIEAIEHQAIATSAITSAVVAFRDGEHLDGRPYRGGDLIGALREAGL